MPSPSRRLAPASFSITIARSASSCRPPDTQLPSIQPYRPATSEMPAGIESSVGFDIEIVTEFQSAEELQNGGISEQD